MIPSSRTCKLLPLLALLVVSCVSYRKAYMGADIIPREKGEAAYCDNEDETITYEHKGVYTRAANYRAITIRYLALLHALNPIATINNRGVDLALEGNNSAAELLFREAVRADAENAALYNNLGVVCEGLDKRGEAVALYGKACILKPGNRRYRMNFLRYADAINRR